MTRTQTVEKQIECMPVIFLTGSMKDLYMRGRSLCDKDHPSLIITGESGTGKELLAKSIHYSQSPWAQFIPINCVNLPYDHFESKIEKFLAAARKDTAEQASGVAMCGPTLFIRDIGRLDPAVRKNLVALLKEKVTQPRRGRHDQSPRIRLIFSCNQPGEGHNEPTFSEPLIKTFNPRQLSILPLRERTGDIQPLASFFVDKYTKEYGKDIGGIHSSALHALENHEWPGNVSELRDVMENAVLLAQHPLVIKDDIRFNISKKFIALESFLCREDFFTLEELERIYIQTVLRRVKSNKSKTAKILGISRNTLQNKIDGFSRSTAKALARKKASNQPPLF